MVIQISFSTIIPMHVFLNKKHFNKKHEAEIC